MSAKDSIKDMEMDIAVLILRLAGEPMDSHAPETLEVLKAYPVEWAMDVLNQETEADYMAELQRGYAKDRI